MKTKKLIRNEHVGKTFHEKEAYRQFLSSKIETEKTESDPIDIDKTNESSYNEDEIPHLSKTQKKSLLLVIKDYANNYWFITIIGGLIVVAIVSLVTFSVNMKISQAVQGEKISNLEKVNDENKNGLSNLKQNFEIFKTEVIKDLEYIKKKFH